MRCEGDMETIKCDTLIIGEGISGLCLARQIKRTRPKERIIVVDKEKHLGLHNLGRNSGVLHAGIYYKSNTIKATTCINGSRRLQKWIRRKGLPIKKCGKIITPTRVEDDN